MNNDKKVKFFKHGVRQWYNRDKNSGEIYCLKHLELIPCTNCQLITVPQGCDFEPLYPFLGWNTDFFLIEYPTPAFHVKCIRNCHLNLDEH